jgi:hypothetical protein
MKKKVSTEGVTPRTSKRCIYYDNKHKKRNVKIPRR